MQPTSSTPPAAASSSRKNRILASSGLVALTVILVVARYLLFEHGVLYGENIANMASLAVAGFIVLVGCLALWIVRGGSHVKGTGTGTDGVAASVAAILGLALTGYSVSEAVAPNTPFAASVPACEGVPVYGAKYFAVTSQDGVNARKGPGIEYQQLNHYPAGCTLGFDGYCVGYPEKDFIIGTPDSRWLLVHGGDELVSAAEVISESAESNLGTAPNPRCAALGGSPQPHTISRFSYDAKDGDLAATAPGAVIVGYSALSLDTSDPGYVGATGTYASPSFSAQISPSGLTGLLPGTSGQILLGAVVCLAEDVPVADSLRAQIMTIKNNKVVKQKTDSQVPFSVATRLAEFACNAG
jgi:hypothetical protein